MPEATPDRSHEIIVCGWDEVFILDTNADPPRKVWSWRAKERPELPERLRDRFGSTDECKPVAGGRQILITSSGSGVALVERESGKALFWAQAANAHSAEMLPGGRIAVAASHAPDGTGDRLILFDVKTPEKEVFHAELPWGHGVVWDGERRLLWALANEDIRVYELAEWETPTPSLKRVARIPLPEGGGHDFSPVPGTDLLTVTTARHVWLFDRARRTFAPHPELGDLAGVKCVSVNPKTGRLVYVQQEGANWWSERLRFLKPAGILYLPGEHLYKARWWKDEPLP